MKLTKTIIDQVTNKLLSPKLELRNKKKQEFEEQVTKFIEKGVPDQVMKFYKNNKNYTKTCSRARLTSNGFNFLYVNLTRNVPANSDYGNLDHLTKQDWFTLVQLHNEFLNAEKEYKDLRVEVNAALTNLKTYKAVQLSFPEAYKYLPTKTSTALAVNYDQLRNKLK